MASGKNTVVRRIGTKQIIADMRAMISSASTWNQGDLLVFNDTTNKVVKPAAEAEGLTFLGVANQTLIAGHVADVYPTDVDASVAITAASGPEYGDVHKVVLKTGDAINPGDLVYLDPATGARGVTVAGTKAIGVYMGAALTAVAGQEIECLIGARHPADVLRF